MDALTDLPIRLVRGQTLRAIVPAALWHAPIDDDALYPITWAQPSGEPGETMIQVMRGSTPFFGIMRADDFAKLPRAEQLGAWV
jgi:hypothetical protein